MRPSYRAATGAPATRRVVGPRGRTTHGALTALVRQDYGATEESKSHDEVLKLRLTSEAADVVDLRYLGTGGGQLSAAEKSGKEAACG